MTTVIDTSDRTLYLSNLPFEGKSVDFQKYQQIVKDSFKTDDVEEVKVKDKRGHDSHNYIFALVTFKTAESATRALSNKTIEIQGKQIILERYALEKDFQLYIKDVGTLKEEQIKQFFGKSKKLAAIQFYTTESLTTALIKFQNIVDSDYYLSNPQQTIDGIVIKVEKYIPKENRREDEQRQLFLKKIPATQDKAQLQAELLKQFEKFGEVIKKIDIEYREGIKVGSAIICYSNSKSLQEARAKFNTKLFPGTIMELDYFLTKKQRQQKGIIFINNIKGDVDIEKFVKQFAKFGKIEAHSFVKAPSKSDQGLIQRGTITYETKPEMLEAIAEYHTIPNIIGYFIGKKVQINVYQDKTQRSDFLKTIKPHKPQLPTFTSNRPNPYMIPGHPGMPGMMGMAPMSIGNPMANPMGMYPPMGMNPYFQGNLAQNPMAQKVSK